MPFSFLPGEKTDSPLFCLFLQVSNIGLQQGKQQDGILKTETMPLPDTTLALDFQLPQWWEVMHPL